MSTGVRTVLLAVSLFQAVVALLFVMQSPVALAAWPFPGTSPLSNLLIGSFFAAAAASTGWAALARRERALVGIGLDYLAIFLPFSVFAFLAAAEGGPQVAAFGVMCVLGVVFGGWLVRHGRARAWRDPRPMPRAVRVSFAAFVVALLVAGGTLVANVPEILPWTITPDLSVLFGCMFLGAAAYFTYGLIEPRWENAVGQLAGFLVYDLVLIGPFLARLPDVEGRSLLSLVAYLAIIVVSAVIAIAYLVVRPETRLGSRSPAVGEGTATG